MDGEPGNVAGPGHEKIPDSGESVSPAGPQVEIQADAPVAEAAGSGTTGDGASAVGPDPVDRAVPAVPGEGIPMGSVSPEELFESLESLGFEIKRAPVLAKNRGSGEDQH